MNTFYEGINNVWNKNRNDKKGRDVIKICINFYAFIFTEKSFIQSLMLVQEVEKEV